MTYYQQRDSVLNDEPYCKETAEVECRPRRDSLADIEEGPSLQQIADETGVPLHILLKLNSAPPSTPLACAPLPPISVPTHETAAQTPKICPPLRRSPRRSPRTTTHYVRPGYVCECPNVAVKYLPPATSPPPMSNTVACNPAPSSPACVESPLFVAEDEPVDVTYPQRPVGRRWAPYPLSDVAPPCVTAVAHTSGDAKLVGCAVRKVGSGILRRSLRQTRHYVAEGYVCECPRMRRVEST